MKLKVYLLAFFLLFVAAGFSFNIRAKSLHVFQTDPAVQTLAQVPGSQILKPSQNVISENTSHPGRRYFVEGQYKSAVLELLKQARAKKDNPTPFYYLGVLYYDLGYYHLALQWFERALKIAPKEPKVLLGLGNAYKMAGLHDSALIVFTRLISLDPGISVLLPSFSDVSKLYFDRGTFFMKKKLFEAAAMQFKKAYEVEPSATAMVYAGQAYMSMGWTRQAEQSFKEAINRDPNNPNAHLAYARLLYKNRDFQDAVQEFQKAVEFQQMTGGVSRDAMLGLGYALYLLGKEKEKEAKESLKRGLEVNPQEAVHHFNWGLAYARAFSFDKAKTSFEKAVYSDPDHTWAQMNLGIAIVNKLLFEEANPKPETVVTALGEESEIGKAQLETAAMFRLKRALQLYPYLYKAHFYLGMLYLRQGNLEKAVSELKQAVALKPGVAVNYHLLGIALGNLGHSEEALRLLRKTVRMAPKNSAAYISLGIACTNLDLFYPCAFNAFHRAAALDPQSQEAYYSLAAVYEILGFRNYARESAQRAVGLDPDYVERLLRLGSTQFGKGMVNDTISIYRTITRIDPKSPKPHYTLGLLYYVKGYRNLAVQELELAIRLDPTESSTANIAKVLLNELRGRK